MIKEFLKRLRGKFKSCKVQMPRAMDVYDSDKPAHGRVLISYIADTLFLKDDDPRFNNHSNQWESKEIIRIFNSLGYVADVINFNDTSFECRRDYDIVFDLWYNIERLYPKLPKHCLKILYATGSHWLFRNSSELQRLEALQFRRKVALHPRRALYPNNAAEFADSLMITGNSFSASTFSYINKPLHVIPVSSQITFPYTKKKMDSIRKNFIWFGSGGLVHKGLDLVLEAFAAMPEYNLYVCGPMEKDFETVYFNELYKTPNIKTLGWLDVSSELFYRVTEECMGVVFVSSSEGGASSVITCMHRGIIPIVNYASSIDVHDYGIMLHETSVEEIKEAVIELSTKPAEELNYMSYNAYNFVNRNHTRENFSKCFRSALDDILKRHQLVK